MAARQGVDADERASGAGDPDIDPTRAQPHVVGALCHVPLVVVADHESLQLRVGQASRGLHADRAAIYVDVVDRRAGDAREAALRRAHADAGRAHGATRPIGPHAVVAPLVERPLELTDDARVEALALQRLDSRLAGGGFRAGGVGHAADLQVEAGQDLFEPDVRIPQVQLLGIRASTALLEIQRPQAERSGSGCVVWQSKEPDVLRGDDDVHARPCAFEFELQAIGDVCVLGVPAARIGFEVAPYLRAGDIAQGQREAWRRGGFRSGWGSLGDGDGGLPERQDRPHRRKDAGLPARSEHEHLP